MCFHCTSVCCPHRQLVDGFLQPEADERGQGVVEDQQHDGIDKVVPLKRRVHDELPRVRALALDDGGDAKDTAETDRQRQVKEDKKHQDLSSKIRNFAYTIQSFAYLYSPQTI